MIIKKILELRKQASVTHQCDNLSQGKQQGVGQKRWKKNQKRSIVQV